MFMKYTGINNGNHAFIISLTYVDPYHRSKMLSPSYCVWIVPGTVDHNGNPVD